MFTPALPALALVGGSLVAAALPLSPAAGAVFATFVGLAVGVDATPETQALRPFLVASAATVIAGVALVAIVMALVLERSQLWRVAARVVGSWISACAILYFTWFFVTR